MARNEDIYITKGTSVISKGNALPMKEYTHDEGVHQINSICNDMDREKSHALPIFHAFCGCDRTSSFGGKGEKSVMEVVS